MAEQDRAQVVRVVRAVQRMNLTIDNRFALIEPDPAGVELATVDEGEGPVEFDLFAVKLSSGEIHRDLTDLEALDLARWWCSLHS
ncbi:hypothetical protein [Nocardia sp. NPDC051833]|uniref:hypothetical protein n=1 Tax=Nocardia sp. NPDC051833 TaxID=3155674 RepID=UPI003431CCF6